MSFQPSEFRVVKSFNPYLPSGLQTQADVMRRRIFVLGLNLIVDLALFASVIVLLWPGEWSKADTVLVLAAIFVIPPVVFSALNSGVGFILKRTSRGGLDYAAPHALSQNHSPVITARTAIVMTLRNDPVEDALQRLKLIRTSLETTGESGHFSFFVMSDTSDPVLAKREEQLVHAWNRALPDYAPVVYRRRLVNAGYSAGNLADFCRNFGEHFEYLVPLDSRSFMTGMALVEMVRIIESNPKIGILQALAIASPKMDADRRYRGFVDRVTQVVASIGEAWWRADCDEYRGRNAIIRLKPFYLHCRMPHLPGRAPFGGAVLAHRQIEAAFMRRAGYEVRGIPIEFDHYEDQPVTLLDVIDEMRQKIYPLWQMPRFIFAQDIAPVYRFAWGMQVLRGVMPFFFTLAVPLLAFKPFEAQDFAASPLLDYAKLVYLTFLFLTGAPYLLGVIDILVTRGRVADFGGIFRFMLSSIFGLGLNLIMLPAFAFRAAFALLASPFTWKEDIAVMAGSAKQAKRSSAFKSFWPASLFGLDLILLMLIGSSTFTLWTLPLMLGYVLIIPVTRALASPALSQIFIKSGIFGVPEVLSPTREIAELVALKNETGFDRAA